MNLSCIPAGEEAIGHNFVEIKTDHRGFSEGPAMSARGLSDKLLVLLHDRGRHKGCMASCGWDSPVFHVVSAMRHHMINHWGTRPQEVEVLLAGGLKHSAEFSRRLNAHLKRMEFGDRIVDARHFPARPIGDAPGDQSPRHLYYDPAGARVEMVFDSEEPGGRAYNTAPGVTVLGENREAGDLPND